MSSILDYLDGNVENNPDQRLYAFLDDQCEIRESYTYRQFYRRTNDIASHIARCCPLSPGDRVLLAYPPGLEIICAFFACVRLGLIPVPVYPPGPQGFNSALYKITFIAKDSGAKAILTDRQFYWSMKVNLARHSWQTLSFKSSYVAKLKWIVSSDADNNGNQNYTKAHSDVLFLQYTSGSTSDPKGVMVSHDNIIHNGDIVVDHNPIGVSWLPQYHDMGLIGYYLFFALKGGTTYGLSPLAFIEKPYLWLTAISKYRATASSAPNFAY